MAWGTEYIEGIKPFMVGKGGPEYRKEDVDLLTSKMIVNDSYFERHVKDMKTDAEKAIQITDKVSADFSASLDRFIEVEKKFADQSKKISGSVRDATEKLANGLSRIEKTANFDRLDRYVDLLERAAKAMTVLAELEETGRLEKIASAIR